MSTHNVIRIKVYSTHEEEGTLTVAATPGMLMARHTAETSWKPHDVAGGVAQKSFALEDNLQGVGISSEIAIAAKVQIVHAKRGDIVNCLLAVDETIVVGDNLVSEGDGTLKKAGAELGEQLVGQAMEAVDTTDSLVVAAQRIMVMVY